MATKRFLVLANETLGGRELLLELEACNTPPGSAQFHVVVPATRVDKSIKSGGERDELGRPIVDYRAQDLAQHRLQAALALLREQGADNSTGEVGPADPLAALSRVLSRPQHWDELIVSTLPLGTSRWLRMDLPHRIGRKFDITIRHVESTPGEDIAEVVAAPLSIDHHELPPDAERFDRPVRIVLVEDTATDAQLARIALDRSELEVDLDVCTSGLEALERLTEESGLAAHPADLVLLDLRMPGMDGLELLERLGGVLDLRSVPVVILSTSTLEEDRNRAHELGALAYIVKDPDFQRFQESLESVVIEQAVTEPALG